MLKGSFLQSWKTTRKRRATTPACGPCSFRFNGPSQKTNHGSYQSSFLDIDLFTYVFKAVASHFRPLLPPSLLCALSSLFPLAVSTPSASHGYV
ncbi:hypothetical protein KEM48_010718 [Puccinia striiformis f. sp. tritici PST-130]|nr:hypothetical protein KEM48_010718 [Puccinia striiformis f. sp. tritici PST-130]